jgi:hypothetical protein
MNHDNDSRPLGDDDNVAQVTGAETIKHGYAEVRT